MQQIVYNNLKFVPCVGGGIMTIEKMYIENENIIIKKMLKK